MFYKALYCNNNLSSCPLTFIIIRDCIMLPFVTITLPSRLIKSASRAEQENIYRFKITIPLTSYDDFLNFLYSARTIKQKRETKTTGEDHFTCHISCTMVECLH